MSRETKQERIVRGMYDQVSDHLHELKQLSENPAVKELDIERWIQSVLRSCLGFTATNGYSVRAQEARGKMRPDLIVLRNDTPIFVIEVKKLGFDLNKSNFRSGKVQLREYLHSLGDVKWGLLSNGYEWRLYDFSTPTSGGVEVLCFDLHNDSDEIDVSRRAVEEVCWSLLDIHESSFSADAWSELSKEATAFSPESLARAILSCDVTEYIAKVIRGEHEYKANLEVLIDKLTELVETGLNDSIPDWNDSRQIELQKYIKTQKRATRKRKKSSSSKVELEPISSIENTDVQNAEHSSEISARKA